MARVFLIFIGGFSLVWTLPRTSSRVIDESMESASGHWHADDSKDGLAVVLERSNAIPVLQVDFNGSSSSETELGRPTPDSASQI